MVPFFNLILGSARAFCELVPSAVKEDVLVMSLLCGGLMDNWWVYIIEKRTQLYVGITTDFENRMQQHGQPAPLYYEGPISKTDGLKRERMLKGWSRKKNWS